MDSIISLSQDMINTRRFLLNWYAREMRSQRRGSQTRAELGKEAMYQYENQRTQGTNHYSFLEKNFEIKNPTKNSHSLLTTSKSQHVSEPKLNEEPNRLPLLKSHPSDN